VLFLSSHRRRLSRSKSILSRRPVLRLEELEERCNLSAFSVDPSGNVSPLNGSSFGSSIQQVLFIESNVFGAQQYLDSGGSGVACVLLDSAGNGLSEIQSFLNGLHNLNSIHVLANDGDDGLELGSCHLNDGSLPSWASNLEGLGHFLGSSGNLNLFGCSGNGPPQFCTPFGWGVDHWGHLCFQDKDDCGIGSVLNFTADTPPAATYGTAFSYQFQTNGSGTVTYSGVNLPTWATLNSTTGVLSGTPTAAGSYTFTVDTSSGSSSASVNVTLVVDPAVLTITASNETKTYGQSLSFQGTQFTTSGLKNGDTIGSVTLSSAGAAATAGVGSYAITASGATSGTFNANNYTITYVNGSLTVNPAQLTITASSQTKTYGSALSFAGTEFTTSGLQNGDTIGSVTLSSAGTAATVGVGSYAITASGATGGTFNANNYTIAYNSGTLKVNPAPLTITADGETNTYGDTLTFVGTEFTDSGLQNGDTVGSVTLSSPGAATTAGVGSYAITASAATGGTFNPANYIITYDPGTLTVNPALLTITADNETKIYGNALSFAGTEFITSGLQNGDTIGSVSLSSAGAAATAGVGSYGIAISGATGGTFNASNYTISYVNGTLTVNPTALTITANNQAKTYGQAFPFQGNEFSVTGLENGDTIGSVTISSSGSDPSAGVGSYDIAISGATGGTFNPANYTSIVYVDGALTVNPAPLTITADDQTRNQGDPNGPLTATFTGLVNGDSSAVVSGLVLNTTATTSSAVGNYPITASSGVAANYTISYVSGTLTVLDPPATTDPGEGIGTFDSSTATWNLRNEISAGAPDAGTFVYGQAGWIAVTGDWNGTGETGIGVFDPTTATWYLRNEAKAGSPDAGIFQYGAPGWIPVVGDWNGTGHTGIGMFDPTTGNWYLRGEASGGSPDVGVFQYGLPGWTPVTGDWTGSGHTGIGVVDPTMGQWYLRNEASGGAADAGIFQYSLPGWKPVTGDWAVIGQTGIGTVDPSTNTWYLRSEASTGSPDAGTFVYGQPGWQPVVGVWTAPAPTSAQPNDALVTDPVDAVFSKLG
jgi:MBG domain (YGX type)/Domain of unknown function (DUF4347)/Putative Ig domain